MKIRQAKKILFSNHWAERWMKLRPSYYDEKRKVWVHPSWHDIPDHTWQKARHKYFGAMKRYYNRHGKPYSEK